MQEFNVRKHQKASRGGVTPFFVVANGISDYTAIYDLKAL